MTPPLTLTRKLANSNGRSVGESRANAIGDDGLTDAERIMLAKKFETTIASATRAEIRATLERVRLKRLARLA